LILLGEDCERDRYALRIVDPQQVRVIVVTHAAELVTYSGDQVGLVHLAWFAQRTMEQCGCHVLSGADDAHGGIVKKRRSTFLCWPVDDGK
jgi:hypothetical protein